MKKLFFILFLPALFTSCKTTGNSIKNVGVMTVFMEAGTLKYYIRPAKMKAAESTDKSYVMIDFTYQMKNREYVSQAYTNFTLHASNDAFIEKAHFLLSSGKTVPLSDIKTLDRDVKQGYIRVSTLLEKGSVKEVLEALNKTSAALEITLDNGVSQKFVAAQDLIDKIAEAFNK